MTAATLRPHRNGTTRDVVKQVRVAIYCRKSTDKGLEQKFNSIESQRELVEAYVQSQQGNGWEALPERYDDGGYTGANVDRPAFQRLLKDVEAHKVDVVATYRLDRLSRSQRDFFEIIDHLERHSVTFVSVTEQFNTTTSQGRFALSISMAVAQLEREVTSERTRDKIHATRRKGQWTGGRPVLGYDAVSGKLVVNTDEAARVREIFKLFADRGSIIEVVEELRRRCWTTKSWTNKAGTLVVGRAFDKVSLRYLLTNPLYIGQISLGDESFDGIHERIIDAETWEAVQKRLRTREQGGIVKTRNKWNLLLKGLLYCVCGSAMSHHYATRRGRKTSYYSCLTLQKQGAKACPGSRYPVRELERHVIDRIRSVGQDEALVAQVVEAAHRELEASGPRLERELQRIDVDRKAFAAEQKHLVAAVSNGADTVPAVIDRLKEVKATLERLAQQAADAQDQIDALEGQTIDEADLRNALTRFDPIWNELFPAEKARLLALCIERVTFDARCSEVSIAFRPDGIRSLATRKPGP